MLSFQLSDEEFQDTACTKKGLDPQMFTLEYKGKRVDLSSTVSSSTRNSNESMSSNFKVRFSGIPNNGTLELVELSQEEIGKEEKVIFGQKYSKTSN